MSSGFHRSPLLRCPYCGERLHPGLVGDLLAHARATGVAVHFGCAECGEMIMVDRTTEVEKKEE